MCPPGRRLAQELHRVVRPGGLVYRCDAQHLPAQGPTEGYCCTNKKHLARDTRIALHLGFALHELKSLFADFSDIYRISTGPMLGLNCPAPVPDLAADCSRRRV